MGRKIAKVITLVFFVSTLASGIFLIYFIFLPQKELSQSQVEVEIDQKYQNNDPKVTGNRLFIPKIGVDMEIGTSPNYLDTGGWIQKTNRDKDPLVIAIHRFGWDTLNIDQKTKQTLYNVDKLQKGDEMLIFWKGQRIEYTIVNKITSTNNPPIKDNQILLYTCRFWNSAERVFVLAERI